MEAFIIILEAFKKLGYNVDDLPFGDATSLSLEAQDDLHKIAIDFGLKKDKEPNHTRSFRLDQ